MTPIRKKINNILYDYICSRHQGVFIMSLRKILVVEPNEKDQKLLRLVIKYLGYEPLIVCDEEQCLLTTKKDLPDLLLMNTGMPLAGGTLNMLREDDRMKRIPVIAIVESATRKEINSFLAQGYAGCVSKPLDVRELDEAIQRALPGA